MSEKRLFVHANESGSEGKVVVLKSTDNMARFKKIAGKKLGIKAKKVFLSTGAEILDVDEMQNNDMLYVSQGEPFYKNAGTGPGQETLHVSVLGSGGVGKSALTLRFVRDFFVKDWDPTIEDAYRKTIDVDDRLVLLEILDTAGQDDFEALRPQWMMDKDGYIFVYSMDSAVSLQELQPFFDLHRQINESKRPQPPIVMVANKKDIVDKDPSKRQVTAPQGRETAAMHNAIYVEASALTGENVNEVFETLIRQVRKLNNPSQTRKKKTCVLL